MKIFVFIISASLLFISITAYAQKDTGPVNGFQSVYAPQKGYYSIGNNASKLQSPASGQVFSGLRTSKKKTVPMVQKGYYATGNNQAKLGEQISFEDVRPSGSSYYKSRPVKGYYSIGRNADKLK
ncbi:hypothetical protein OCK74_23085 [Chitinophagaceae bacterium LB-8]|uniref:Secreted protein n=1 Tax=Paraflavisolibacter caeni TaxID=2982496 RepID=A0A9X3BH78_9BACT|nr:hypothetical protein [Paraflavisolibacter caeni]MCU7552024.1 hypothetical protein [Paraflavisolibacter caeni]